MNKAKKKTIIQAITLTGSIAVFFLLLYYVFWPLIQNLIATNMCKKQYGPDYKAVRTIYDEKNPATQACGYETQCKPDPWYCIKSKGEKKSIQ